MICHEASLLSSSSLFTLNGTGDLDLALGAVEASSSSLPVSLPHLLLGGEDLHLPLCAGTSDGGLRSAPPL